MTDQFLAAGLEVALGLDFAVGLEMHRAKLWYPS